MSKYRKRTVMYCLLLVASMVIGQAAKKTSLPYIPLAAYWAGLVFVILAAFNAIKAYQDKII